LITVGIAEDQALIRDCLAIVLGLEKDVEVRWTASNGLEALAKIKEQPVDIVLMDLRMPEMDGVTAIQQIHKEISNVKKPLMVVLTTFHHDEWLVDALSAGAVACFLKEIPPQLLILALRDIISGHWDPAEWSEDWRKFVPEIQFKTKIKHKSEENNENLTSRDLDILRKLCAGSTNSEIALGLHLSEGTIKNYVSTLYAKLGARHRAEAVRFARDRGIC
jgi:two-component system, NarL family, response regulator DesR